MMVKSRGVLLAAALLPFLAACSSDGPMDAISSMNPFKDKAPLIPANAQSVLQAADPTGGVVNAPARIGGVVPSNDWPQAGGPSSNDAGNMAGSLAGQHYWSLKAGASDYGREMMGLSSSKGQRISSRLVAADGVVYLLDTAGVVSGYKIANGGATWHVNAYTASEKQRIVGGGLAVSGGKVMVATGLGDLLAIDTASSSIAWRARLDAPARSAPAVGNGKVVVVTQAGTVMAFDIATGASAWKATTESSTASLLGTSSVAVAGGLVVVPGATGEILAFDVASGAQKWQATIVGGTSISAAAGLRDASASPVMHGDAVYATGIGGSLMAISAKTGETTWQLKIGSADTPVVSGDSIFLLDLQGRMIAVDRNKGKVLWTTAMPPLAGSTKARATWAGPVMVGGTLWSTSNDGRIAAVDAVSGAIGAVTTIGFNGAIAPIYAAGKLMVLSGDGMLIAVK